MPAIRRPLWVARPLLFAAILLILLLGGHAAALAVGPPPVQTFFIPLPEDHVLQALRSIYPSSGGTACTVSVATPSSPINTYVSISIISDGTIIYYDHWEDGFEVDPSAPVQPTTEIWGDGNAANGAPPGIPADVLNADTVIILDNEVNTSTLASVIDFDGGDRVSSSRIVAMTRAAWATGSETLLAGAVEVYDTFRWGQNFRAPVGEDVSTANQLFEYTSLSIMAATDGTNVAIDANADGAAEINITLDRGQPYLLDGGVLAGGAVNASAPIQVAMITGDRCDLYESRWYVLFPDEQWSDSYYSPVGTIPGDGTRVFLYNPADTVLRVSWETVGGAQTPIDVPARGVNFATVPDNSGAHFFTNGSPFIAVAAVGATGTAGFNSRADWGFSLVPEEQLTAQILVGLGIGRDPTSNVNLSENGSPVWVTAVLPDGVSAPVDVCADYDGDNVGLLTDAFGFNYDQRITLDPLASAEIFDSDGDQTGMVVYVCDIDAEVADAKLAAAWGQAPGIASAAAPGLDLGTTAPPAATFFAGKGAQLALDPDGDGLFSPGDTVEYEVVVGNASRVPIAAAIISDTVPAYTAYVAGSTTFSDGVTTVPIADSVTGTAFPLDDGGVTVNDIPVRGVFTIRFRVVVNSDIPVTVPSIQNTATVSVGRETARPTVETPIDRDPAIVIEKSTLGQDADSPTGPLVRVGDPITWTYRITNTGEITLTNVVVTDSVAGVTPVYVSGDAGGDTGRNNILEPNESWTYQATGAAIAGQYANVGYVQAQAADGDIGRDNDPSHYFGVQSGIGIEKTVDRPVVVNGDSVTYTVIISNTGNVALVQPNASDPLCPLTFIGGDNGNNILDVGEIWRYTCTRILTADTINTATATGVDPLNAIVIAQDSVVVDVINPAITLDKVGSRTAVQPGETVIYTYTVTNPGDSALQNVVLGDDKCNPVTFVDGDAGGDGVLSVGEIWRYTCSAAITEATTNIAVVTAQDTLGNVVRAEDRYRVVIGLIYLPIIYSPPPPPPPCPPPDGCPVPGVDHLKGIAVHEGRNQLFITSRNNDSLIQIDADYVELLGQAETGDQPWSVVVDEGSNRVYVSNFGSNDVWIYDATTLSVLAKVPVGGQPALMAILPALDTVFVVVRDGSRIAVLQGTAKVADLESGGSGPYGIAADPVGQRVFVAHRDTGHIVSFSQVDGAWTRSAGPLFEDGRRMFDIAYNPANNKLYLVYANAAGDWFLDVWKPEAGPLWGQIRIGIPIGSGGSLDDPLVGGTGLEVSPATGRAYNVNTGAMSLTVLDGTINGIVDSIGLGEDPFPIAINGNRGIVYVGLRTPGRLVKIAE